MPEVGHQLGRYTLLKKLAVGGMGEIFLAARAGPLGFAPPVALKVLKEEFASDRTFVDMLVDEANISMFLNHQNVVSVLDFGEQDGIYYIAMEYVQGCTVKDLIEGLRNLKRKLDTGLALYIGSELCRALKYAHTRNNHSGEPLNIIHRDVTPGNVLVSIQGEVKLTDFGIARAKGRVHQTQAGVLKGKFGYMAPEMIRYEKLDGRADIFSAGVVIYEMVAGRHPVEGAAIMEAIVRFEARQVDNPSVHNPDIPKALDAVVIRALEPKTPDRWPSAAAFGTAIQELALQDAETRKAFKGGAASLASLMREVFPKTFDNPVPKNVLDQLLEETRARESQAKAALDSARPAGAVPTKPAAAEPKPAVASRAGPLAKMPQKSAATARPVPSASSAKNGSSIKPREVPKEAAKEAKEPASADLSMKFTLRPTVGGSRNNDSPADALDGFRDTIPPKMGEPSDGQPTWNMRKDVVLRDPADDRDTQEGETAAQSRSRMRYDSIAPDPADLRPPSSEESPPSFSRAEDSLPEVRFPDTSTDRARLHAHMMEEPSLPTGDATIPLDAISAKDLARAMKSREERTIAMSSMDEVEGAPLVRPVESPTGDLFGEGEMQIAPRENLADDSKTIATGAQEWEAYEAKRRTASEVSGSGPTLLPSIERGQKDRASWPAPEAQRQRTDDIPEIDDGDATAYARPRRKGSQSDSSEVEPTIIPQVLDAHPAQAESEDDSPDRTLLDLKDDPAAQTDAFAKEREAAKRRFEESEGFDDDEGAAGTLRATSAIEEGEGSGDLPSEADYAPDAAPLKLTGPLRIRLDAPAAPAVITSTVSEEDDDALGLDDDNPVVPQDLEAMPEGAEQAKPVRSTVSRSTAARAPTSDRVGSDTGKWMKGEIGGNQLSWSDDDAARRLVATRNTGSARASPAPQQSASGRMQAPVQAPHVQYPPGGPPPSYSNVAPATSTNWTLIIGAMMAAAITVLAVCGVVFTSVLWPTFELSSNPSPVDVFVDGIKVGETPIKVSLKPDVAHLIEFKKLGYPTVPFRDVRAGFLKRVRVQEVVMKMRKILLRISADEDADVFMGDTHVGRGKEVTLPELDLDGPVKLRVEAKGYEIWSGDFAKGSEIPPSLEVVLTKSQTK